MRKETEDTSIGAGIDTATENDKTLAAADATAEPSANIDNVGDTEIVFAKASNLKAKYQKFTNEETNWAVFAGVWMNPDDWPVAATKNDAPAITAGPIVGAEVTNKSMLGTTMLIIDIDGGSSMEESAAALRGLEIEAVIVPTFRYGTTQTDVKHDDLVKWANKNRHAEAIREIGTSIEATEEIGRRYLSDKGKIIPKIAAEAKYTGKGQTSAGIVYHFEHEPLPKHRIFIPLTSHFNVSDFVSGDTTQGQVLEAYSNAYLEACSELEIPFDKACKDISRRYYWPSKHAADAKVPQPIHVQGKPYDLEAKIEKALAALKAEPKPKTAHKASTSAPSPIFEGFNLKTFAAQYAKTFKIEDALASHGLVRGERPNGGSYVECHEKGHSGTIGETFAVNGDGEKGFVLHCSGATGGCCDKDRLGHLLGYLENGELTLDDLRNPEFGGGEISNRAAHERQRWDAKQSRPTRVIDGEGVGFDAEVFAKNKLNLLDFDKLRALRGDALRFNAGVSAEVLAREVREGHITLQELIDCCASSETFDAYRASIREVIAKWRAGMTKADRQGELKKLAKMRDVRVSDVEDDFKAEQERVEKERADFGELSFEETQKLRARRNYSSQFAIINTGGKGVVLNKHEPDLSRAIMTHDDFKRLYKNDYTETVDADGKPITIFHAESWLAKPPRDADFYRRGLVFRPTSIARASVGCDDYNLWKGFLIDPDPSGSCNLFYDLLREVWCNGDAALYEWVKEWFWHIVAYPGDKCRTGIAIRGGQGDGKSIVTEKLMAPIYGDLLVRVANARLVTGDFNEILSAKLLVTLEEAAFAGDKQAFAKMKEIVTGDTILINPKHKAPIPFDNYARAIVVSNQQHFMDIEHDDRRWTVLNSNPAWKGSNKFGAMRDQWNNGGAARFMHDALNYDFRRLVGTSCLVISTKMKTEHETVQRAESRSLLDRFLIDLLVRGDFSASDEFLRSGCLPLDNADATSSVDSFVWKMDHELDVTGQFLADELKRYYKKFAPQKLQHAPGSRAVLDIAEKFFGPISDKPRKRVIVGEQLARPRFKMLPKRAHALRYAYKRNLITADEFYEAGGEDAGMVCKKTLYAIMTPPRSAAA
jgi:hypothetical protein